MKGKDFLRMSVLSGAVVLAALLSSCNKEEQGSAPTVSVEAVSSDASSITLRISSEGATELAYMQIKDLQSVPSAKGLLSAGTQVEVPGGDVEVTGLEPSTDYYFAVVAANGDLYSEIATVEASTLEAECTFELTVTGATSEAIAWRVVPSVDNQPYYVAALPASYASSSDEELHAAVLEQITEAAGGSLEDYLSANMFTGTRTGSVAGLEPQTEYLLTVMGLSASDGSLQTGIAKENATTAEEVELTFTLSYSDVTATTAHVSVVPSDDEATYVWLCQPSTNYPDLSEDDADEIAEMYVTNQGAYLEQGIGLYTGSWDIPDFEVNSDSKYYLFAFGYTPGIGITSSCELEAFDTGHSIQPDEFEAEIVIDVATAKRLGFQVRPTEACGAIYYLPVVLPKAEYTWKKAQEEVVAAVQSNYNLNIDFNPGYTMTDAVSSVCYRGTYEYFEATGLTPETDYVIAVVAMSNDGKPGNAEVTAEESTTVEKQSGAVFSNTLVGIYDGDEALDAGLFTESSASLSGNALAVFEVKISEEAVHCYYSSQGGDYSDPEEEYKTDDDLMSWLPDNPYTVEVEDHSTTHIIVPFQYYDLAYWDYTFLTWANDAEGVWGPVSRTFVRAISTEVDPIEDLVELVNSLESSSAAPVLLSK